MNGDPKILIYEASLSFLKAACSIRQVPGRSLREVRMLQRTVEDYITSMTCDSVLSGIVESLPCRKRVLELSNKLELTNDPNLRTAIRADEERIATYLVSILSSKSDEETVLRLEGDSAQHFLDVVQETLDRGFIAAQEHTKMALRIIRKLSALCDKLPSSLFIVGVTGQDEHPTFGGGYGDIYRASYGNQRVALKRMRHFLRGSDLRRMRLKFCREALVWKDLHHPNILPFLGIDADSFPSSLCMVSPWMEHGTVLNYLKSHGHTNLDKLLYEIAQGLEYLHSRSIVHGDLRGTNILIKEDWSACLTDFGLSILSDATSTMSTNRGGSIYWMAPELLDPDRFGVKFARTPATDVYAFGCVCLELYTERPPFSNVSETAALLKVLNGERPERPPGPPAMSDTLWQLVTEFWAENPTTRPSTQYVVQAMTWPPTDPKQPRPQLLFGSHPLTPQSPPGLAPVEDSFPSDVTSTKTAIPTDTSSPLPLFSVDDELEKGWPLPPEGVVSKGSHSPRLLDLLSVLADGGIGTEEPVGPEHQWPEANFQEASLVTPGLTVHVGIEALPVWPDANPEEASPVHPELIQILSPSPQPVHRRRRSLPSITTVVDSERAEGVLLQRPSRPRLPSPIHVEGLVGIDHRWPEVELQEASLANPVARGLTVHADTETLPVWPDAPRQKAPLVDSEVGEFTPLSPVRRRRRSLLSTTAVVDGEGVLLQRQSHSPSPIPLQELHSHYRGKSTPEGPILATFRELKTDKPIHDLSPSSRRVKWWRAKSLDAFMTKSIWPTKIATGHAARTASIQLIDQYEVLYDFSAAPDDPNEISFHQGDLVDLLEKQDFEWWQVRKADGSLGRNCTVQLPSVYR
ncbi:kinase-like domain-containing protein [Mycena sanguinolenta]|nr:kinase-like domain-containing protein [Mycena sanguinolenta]